jgi:hypothetical protein
MNLVEYDGDLSKLDGELLAGWFIANPNGPTAFALGFVEAEGSRRLLYNWMHFTGGGTWLSPELLDDLDETDPDFGEILLSELLSINNDAVTTGKDVKLLESIPSFAVLNDDPRVCAAFAALIKISLGYGKDWGRELYYLGKYHNDFFSRCEEEYRDIYENLKVDPNANADFLRLFWLANQHRKGFQEWEPNRYTSSELTEKIFNSWYARVTDPAFIAGAAFRFAQMWVGATFMAGYPARSQDLNNAGKYQSLADALKFFENMSRPLLPPQIDEDYVRNYLKL